MGPSAVVGAVGGVCKFVEEDEARLIGGEDDPPGGGALLMGGRETERERVAPLEEGGGC